MTKWNGNIIRVTGPLCVESTGHRWIPVTKASDAELWCFFICVWTNGWVNNRDAGDLGRHRAHYYVIIMFMCQERLHTSSVVDDWLFWSSSSNSDRILSTLWLSSPSPTSGTVFGSPAMTFVIMLSTSSTLWFGSISSFMSTAVRKNHLPGIGAHSVEKGPKISIHTITHLKYILNWNAWSQIETVFIAYSITVWYVTRKTYI